MPNIFTKLFLASTILVVLQSASMWAVNLHLAVYNGDLGAIKDLVEKDANIDESDQWNRTPLHVAVRCENIEIVKYLAEHGANIDKKMLDGFTVLHYAIYYAEPNIVKYLVQHGANLVEKNDKGKTARELAQQENNPACAAYLRLAEDFYLVVAGKMGPDIFFKKYCETKRPVASKQNIADIRKLLHLGTREIADMFYAWCEKNKKFAVDGKWASGKAWMYFDLCKNVVADPVKKLFWYERATYAVGNKESEQLNSALKFYLHQQGNQSLLKDWTELQYEQKLKKIALQSSSMFNKKQLNDLKISFK